MPEFQTVRMSDTGEGLFSGSEIEGLMRVEFERAKRHKFPLVCMRIAVDRLDPLHDLYGVESKDEIVRAVTAALRDSMRDSDHLGMTQDDRFLAVFPHTTPETGQLLAKRLLANARKMRFERDGRSLRISLSIGVAHNRDSAATSFETLLAVADDGLAVADAGGGDRYVETELYALYEKKHRGGRGGSFQPILAPPAARPAPAPARQPTHAELLGQELLQRLMAQGLDLDALSKLPPDQIAEAIMAFQSQKDRAAHGGAGDKGREIENLERRIAKLTHILGVTEEELRRVAALKNVDLGIASAYDAVQGLSAGDSQFEQKREMMKIIFEANFKLRQQLSPDSGPPPAD